jgi:hypothetical protein
MRESATAMVLHASQKEEPMWETGLTTRCTDSVPLLSQVVTHIWENFSATRSTGRVILVSQKGAGMRAPTWQTKNKVLEHMAGLMAHATQVTGLTIKSMAMEVSDLPMELLRKAFGLKANKSNECSILNLTFLSL